MMEMFDELTEDNFVLFAARNYYNPTCINSEDFYEDLNRFKYIKRLFNRYYQTDTLSERLILNHLIVIFNVFGVDAALKMLEFKFNKQRYWPVLKPFLIFLKYIRNDQYTGIVMDPTVVQALREI